MKWAISSSLFQLIYKSIYYFFILSQWISYNVMYFQLNIVIKVYLFKKIAFKG